MHGGIFQSAVGGDCLAFGDVPEPGCGLRSGVRRIDRRTLATDDGLLLWRPNAEDVEDRSKNRRHDFYLVKKLTIPDNLAVGKYALRMSVTDRNTNKIAVVTLPIEITP